MEKKKMRFSLRNKLLLVFGLLTFVVGFILALIGVRTARKAVTEKVATHLIDKATDTAEIIDGRVNTMFQFLEGIARMPFLYDKQTSVLEKARLLSKEAGFNELIQLLAYINQRSPIQSIAGRIIFCRCIGYSILSRRKAGKLCKYFLV